MNKDIITIGSRGSRLALWQAEWARERLRAHAPHLDVRIEIIKTTGDVLKTAPLSLIGGRGVFTKELEEALLDRRIDIAVHSLKDLPTTLPAGLTIAAVTEREDPHDALILRADVARDIAHNQTTVSLAALPVGAIVGTSSLRRLAQLKHQRPDAAVKDLRGNVDTRLRKLDAGEYDAIILAAAGLNRLGLADRISAKISMSEMLPAVSQGALGIETRDDDRRTIEEVAALDDALTRAACTAERALLAALGGGCQAPLAAHARVVAERLTLTGLVAGLSGDTIIRDESTGEARRAAQVGYALAEKLREQGAESLMNGPVMR